MPSVALKTCTPSCAGRPTASACATVYRHLQALVDQGEVDAARADDGEASYRRCGTTTHHHLVCRTRGRAVEISGREIESWLARVANTEGFTNVAPTVEIFGTCATCTNAAAASIVRVTLRWAWLSVRALAAEYPRSSSRRVSMVRWPSGAAQWATPATAS